MPLTGSSQRGCLRRSQAFQNHCLSGRRKAGPVLEGNEVCDTTYHIYCKCTGGYDIASTVDEPSCFLQNFGHEEG